MSVMSDEITNELDLIRPSLASLAKAGLHILLPWKGRPQRLGTGFSSAIKTENENPWRPCPFVLPQSHDFHYVGEVEGGVSSFSDAISSTSSSSLEHTTGSLGITVGNAFISGNATAKYDKAVQEMSNAVIASRHATFRCGRVLFVNEPLLSPDALQLLASGRDGPRLFSAKYGDYYVAGFELGADAGACLAAKASARLSTETVSLSLTVKVLFVSKTIEKNTTTSDYSASADLTFQGYDTLRDENKELHVASKEPCRSVRLAADEFSARVISLQKAAETALAEVKLDISKPLDGGGYEQLVRSGLVVQLVLMPYQSLTEYATLLYG